MRYVLPYAVALLVAAPRVARAVQTYPSEIQAHLGLSYTPPCTVCHANNNGGLGTVVSPFGEAMMAHGLSTDFNTLDRALDALATSNVDSNGDGVTDIRQLKEGKDPNTGAALSNVEREQFGCGLRVAGRTGQRPALILTGLAFLAVCRRARRVTD